MEKREIAYTKQCVLITRDWDAFQAILRKMSKITSEKAELPVIRHK